jgi:hypothetical protein
MEPLILSALVANIFAIVYCRLMLGHYRERATGERDSGFIAVVSYPSRHGLPEEGLRYWRRYWWALACLIAQVCVVLLLRLERIEIALSAAAR